MPRIKVDNAEPDPNPVIVNPVPTPPVFTPKSPTPEPVAVPHSSNDTDNKIRLKSGSSTLTAFSAFPDKVQFEGEDEDEQIILLMRAHVITNIKWVLATIGLLIIPIILFPILASLNVIPSIGVGVGFVFTILWYAVTATYAFINFLYWFYNVYIVTNERIVDIDWYSIIYRKTNSTRISKIQDVSSTRAGVFASIFDYGDIHIQTAAEESDYDFASVPHPDLVSKKIQELMEQEEKEWEVNPDR